MSNLSFRAPTLGFLSPMLCLTLSFINLDAQDTKSYIDQLETKDQYNEYMISQTNTTLNKTSAILASTSNKVSTLAEVSEIMIGVINEQQQRIKLAEYRLESDTLDYLKDNTNTLT